MKKILISLLVLVSVIFIATSATDAYLSDQETSAGNSLAAGTWDNGRVVINEVLYDPSGPEPNDEWIELYNAGGVNVDLSGHVLADNTGFLTLTSLVLAPGQFAVYARDASSFTAKYGFAPNFSGSTIALSNSGDYITLRNPSNVLIDALVWDTATFPGVIAHYDVIQDHAIARYPDGTDTDNCALDFADDSTPTPGGPNV